MRLMRFWVILILLTQNGCSLLTEKPDQRYIASNRHGFKPPVVWGFDGRLAITTDKDALSASVAWIHNPEVDVFELSGPLAQGRVKITVRPQQVSIDDGDGIKVFDGEPEQIITEQLGLPIPVKSLCYWVLGLNDPGTVFVIQGEGFVQSGWTVQYKSMQTVKNLELPYKIGIEHQVGRLKLIIDQWNIL